MTAIGQPRPEIFSVDKFLDVVEMMINSDEVERALHMLDNMPAYYRDHVPERARAIRERLHRQLWTPVQYKGIYDELEHTPNSHWPMRAKLLETEVAKQNTYGGDPYIMELAPGGLFLAQELKARGHSFTYESYGLDGFESQNNSRFITSGKIFCAFELVEHLANPYEIYQNYLKFGCEADIVMLSTPLYTYGGGMPDWQDRELGHLRAYTPSEFHKCAADMFQGYKWECFTDDTIVLIGRR